MDRFKVARNVAIVLLIAAAVELLPGGGRAADTFEALLLVGFGLGFGYLGLRLYREHHVALYGLGDRFRAVLYGSLALGLVILMAKSRMWASSLGVLLWFVLLGLVAYGLVAVYRHWRAY